MKIAILEPDLRTLDRALEMLSSAGHLCFGARTDDALRALLEDVAIDLVLLDWAAPDDERQATLHHLMQYESYTPVVLCVTPHTADEMIDAGMRGGANICLEKPLRSVESIAYIHTLGLCGNLPAAQAVSRLM